VSLPIRTGAPRPRGGWIAASQHHLAVRALTTRARGEPPARLTARMAMLLLDRKRT